MNRIDFRSDTVTWPTPKMRQVMAQADVGDDVYGEDPTINALEALAAEKVGKEAGLFVASGTMGNVIATLTHATRGDEAIMGQDAHVFLWEAGSMAGLGGVMPHTLPTDEQGRMDLTAVSQAIRPDNEHCPRTRLILVENSYGNKQGYPIAPDYFASIRKIADQHNLLVHMDGARFFNTAVALKLDPHQITQHVDSITFCLSKGLCAPVGSVLCGSKAFIQAARRTRKMLGGGMRQAGILAAAGLVSLNEMIDRLADDHANAKKLAQGLAKIPGIIVQPDTVRTNMVFFALADDLPLSGKEVTAALQKRANIWLSKLGPRTFRAVLHYWIGTEEVDLFLKTVREIIGE